MDEAVSERDQQAEGSALPEFLPAAPNWRRRPCDRILLKDPEQFSIAANSYFEWCDDNERQPKLCELALALGVAGPVTLQRMGMRNPDLRWAISRCFTAIAAGYEEKLMEGPAAGPIFMLKHLPEFDPEDLPGARPVQYFSERREITIHEGVRGVQRPEDEGRNLSPRDAYIRLIRGEDVSDPVTDHKPGELLTLTAVIEHYDDEHSEDAE